MKSIRSSLRDSGIKGISSCSPIFSIAANGLSKSHSHQGTVPVAISNTVQPNDHMSADVPYFVYVMTFYIIVLMWWSVCTSGGIHGIEPLRHPTASLESLLKRVIVFSI